MTNVLQRTEHSTFLRGAEELFLGQNEPSQETVDLRVVSASGAASQLPAQAGSHSTQQQPGASMPDLSASELKELVQKTFALVAPGLAHVEQTIRASFVTDSTQLFEISRHLLETGGKRIRPILTLLSQLFLAPSNPDDGRRTERFESLVKAAAGIELIHMATLLHDDIIDQSSKRRHRETAYVTYGMTPTLLAGDFLWVRAFGLCAHLGEYVVSSTERACVELTEGELMEGTLSKDRPFGLDDYLQIIGKKTASLFSLSAALGAHFAGASIEEREHLAAFGREAGIAFQMVDDILDVVSTDDLLGKPAGTDLRQRTPSLVNVLWLSSDRAAAESFFGDSEMTAEKVEAARTRIVASPVIHEARALARERTDRARDHLRAISATRKDEAVEQLLVALLEYTLRRCL